MEVKFEWTTRNDYPFSENKIGCYVRDMPRTESEKDTIPDVKCICGNQKFYIKYGSCYDVNVICVECNKLFNIHN